MKKYAKIECGRLVAPQNYPGYIVIDGEKVYNPTEEQWLNNGYKPLVETLPEEIEGKIAIAHYEETDTEITQTWGYVDAPTPEDEPMEEEVSE